MKLAELSRKIKSNLFDMLMGVLRKSANFESNTVSLNVGEVVYLDNKKGTYKSKETLILLHGLGADKDTWLQFARYLTRKYRIIIPDLPGHGQSVQDFSIEYSVEAQAQCVCELLETLGIKRVHIVGNSMGGQLLYSSPLCSQRLLPHLF
jgi:abhydrolase domain-containing protein 6